MFRAHSYCLRCHYVLDGLPAGTCPECGRPFDPERRRTVGRILPPWWLRVFTCLPVPHIINVVWLPLLVCLACIVFVLMDGQLTPGIWATPRFSPVVFGTLLLMFGYITLLWLVPGAFQPLTQWRWVRARRTNVRLPTKDLFQSCAYWLLLLAFAAVTLWSWSDRSAARAGLETNQAYLRWLMDDPAEPHLILRVSPIGEDIGITIGFEEFALNDGRLREYLNDQNLYVNPPTHVMVMVENGASQKAVAELMSIVAATDASTVILRRLPPGESAWDGPPKRDLKWLDG